MTRFASRHILTLNSSALVYVVLLLVCGCGASKQPTHTVAEVAQVKEVTTCELVNPVDCVGQFGFAIDNSGNFTAGPSPSGKTVTGSITPGELSSLQAALGPVVQGASMSCDSQAAVGGVSDTISAAFIDGSHENLFTFSGQSCFLGASTSGMAFRDLFHQLLTKYYPNPFPA